MTTFAAVLCYRPMATRTSSDSTVSRMLLLRCVSGLFAAASTTTLCAACPPDDALAPAQLEAAGVLVGNIAIRRLNVFDTSVRGENKSLFRAANRLHWQTREQVIRRQLLIEPGALFQQRLLDETARLLRATAYLRDVEVSVLRCIDGRVDVEVQTRDVWSLNPAVSGGRTGGESSSSFSLQEVNMFGTGALVDFSRRSDEFRRETMLRYENDHQFRPWTRLDLQVTDSSDGSGWALGLQQPFYALDTTSSWGVKIDRLTLADSLYTRGEEVAEFRQRNSDFDAWWGYSSGLQGDRVTRYTVGLRDERRDFLPSLDPALQGPLPTDRQLSGPWIGIETIRNDWALLRNYDQIDVPEDKLLGQRWFARLGWSDSTFGGARDAWWIEAEASRGVRLPNDSLLRLQSALATRLEDGSVRDLTWRSSARFYREISPRQRFVATLETQYCRNLDLDGRTYLGGDTGLRGYPLRWAGGESFARATVEQRYFTDWHPWRLLRVGGAVFADVGRAWGSDGLSGSRTSLLADIGVGLRLANTRSAFARIIHVDLVVPLDNDPSLKKIEFVIEARREF